MSAHAEWQRPDAAARLRILADAYGLDETQRRDLVPLLTIRTRSMHDFLRDQAALGTEPWTTHWKTGHGDAWRNDADYIAERDQLWTDALLD